MTSRKHNTHLAPSGDTNYPLQAHSGSVTTPKTGFVRRPSTTQNNKPNKAHTLYHTAGQALYNGMERKEEKSMDWNTGGRAGEPCTNMCRKK